jgi:hypothetical protein
MRRDALFRLRKAGDSLWELAENPGEFTSEDDIYTTEDDEFGTVQLRDTDGKVHTVEVVWRHGSSGQRAMVTSRSLAKLYASPRED